MLGPSPPFNLTAKIGGWNLWSRMRRYHQSGITSTNMQGPCARHRASFNGLHAIRIGEMKNSSDYSLVVVEWLHHAREMLLSSKLLATQKNSDDRVPFLEKNAITTLMIHKGPGEPKQH